MVWPAHVGFASHEAEYVPAERRAQIQWRVDGDQIIGGAQPFVPPGEYPCLQYFSDLTSPHVGVARFQHPFVQTVGDYVVVDPITNDELRPAGQVAH